MQKDEKNNGTTNALTGPIAEAVRYLARSVMPTAAPSHDAAGVYVTSLTEAVMGVTAGLVQIAHVLSEIRDMLSDREANAATPVKPMRQAESMRAPVSTAGEVDPVVAAKIRELFDAGLPLSAVADILTRAGMLASHNNNSDE